MEQNLKFRAWHYPTQQYIYMEMLDIGSFDYTPNMPDPRLFDHSILPVYAKPESFTGLYDKDGTMIYEGDFVSFFAHAASGTIKYKPRDGYGILTNDGEFIPFSKIYYINDSEVIGTVFENPELLK